MEQIICLLLRVSERYSKCANGLLMMLISLLRQMDKQQNIGWLEGMSDDNRLLTLDSDMA